DEEFYAGDFPHMLSAYEASTDGPVRPPIDEFALIKWRGRSVYTGPQNLFDDIHRFRAAGIPIGFVLLDDVWQSCMGTLAFDPLKFPDPAALIGQVHALRIKFMLWISPKVVCHQGYPANARLGPPDDATLDLNRRPVIDEFQ